MTARPPWHCVARGPSSVAPARTCHAARDGLGDGRAGRSSASWPSTALTWPRAGFHALVTDAEIEAATGYGDALRQAGFRLIPEIQPSRHRMSLGLPAGSDDASIPRGATKLTRQRIAAADKLGLRIVRYDTAGWPDDGTLFSDSGRPPAATFEAFYALLDATGERRDFGLRTGVPLRSVVDARSCRWPRRPSRGRRWRRDDCPLIDCKLGYNYGGYWEHQFRLFRGYDPWGFSRWCYFGLYWSEKNIPCLHIYFFSSVVS